MKTIRIIAIITIVAIVGFVFTAMTLIKNIPLGKVGVLTREYAVGGAKGVVPEDFAPGWHPNIGPLHSWQLYDSTVQTLEMTREPHHGSSKGRDDIKVQSSDGYQVSVDVTVKFRIMKGKAHLLYQNTGSGSKYKIIVRNEAEKSCIEHFGKMNTEDFYNPEKRRNIAKGVQKSLSDSLKDNYVEIIDVLIRNVQFDPDYENKIRKRKLADQEVEVNKSMKRSLEMQGKRQVVEAETKKMLSVIQQEKQAALITMEAQVNREITKIVAEYEQYATEKRADADLIAAEKTAKGNLLEKQAEAEGERLRNQAMQGVGGSTIVALEAAKNLNLKEITISTVETDILDVDKMATKLGVPEEK